ncbi:MAG: hypothetical protein ACI8Y7_000834 [Candidatus Woesearchaeota archaeon]|jgi:hypothetical protein
MVDRKMCLGISKTQLMVRLDPDIYEQSLKKEGCNEMNFTGRPMKRFVFIDPEAMDREDDLKYWVQLAIDYNPKAKRSTK